MLMRLADVSTNEPPTRKSWTRCHAPDASQERGSSFTGYLSHRIFHPSIYLLSKKPFKAILFPPLNDPMRSTFTLAFQVC